MPIKDPIARRENHKRYMVQYLSIPKNYAKHLARVARNKKRYRKIIDDALDIFRATGCLNCEEKEPCVLVAHHLDPDEKEFSIAKMKMRNMYNGIAAELKKCVCLCHNCHFKYHAGVIDIPGLPPVVDRKIVMPS
jgi:hypothetical protein